MTDNFFYYASLYNLPAYLNSYWEDVGYDKIRALIPHRYVDGKDHGKKCEGGYRWNKEIDADGLEKPLKALKEHFWHYCTERMHFLSELYDQEPLKQVFMVDEGDEHEPHLDIVFSDVEAMKIVRFDRLMQDCRAIPGDPAYLAEVLKSEEKRLFSFLEERYQDMMKSQ